MYVHTYTYNVKNVISRFSRENNFNEFANINFTKFSMKIKKRKLHNNSILRIFACKTTVVE